MKGVLFCAALVAAILTLAGRASAMVEYCPASLNFRAIDTLPGTYAFSLSAQSPRTVSGNVALHTEQGWFSVPFNSVKLSETVERWSNRGAPFTRTEYTSDYQFVRFSQPTKVLSAFVSDAKTSGESQFAWDAKGDVACAGLGDDQFADKLKTRRLGGLEYLNPPADPKPSDSTAYLSPSISAAPGQTDCAKPFAEAYVSRVVQPEYPLGLRGVKAPPSVSLIEVAVSSTGALDDVWVFAPSGFTQFDAAALTAAKNSLFHAGRSFCQDVPGLYIFRAEFRPN